MNQSSKWLTEDATQSSLRENSLEVTFRGKFVCTGFHGLLQGPETTGFLAATTAALHTSHLQRLASIVETCTIFNWPSKHSGQQREESGLPQLKEKNNTKTILPVCHSHPLFLILIFFKIPPLSFLILLFCAYSLFDLSEIFNQISANRILILFNWMFWSPIDPNCFVGLNVFFFS